MWTMQEGVEAVIKENWCATSPVVDSLAHLSSGLFQWNHDVFGNLFRSKLQLLARINGIQNVVDYHLSPFLARLKEDLVR